jgi:uncharacterized protein YndB with AHSA1/START domain
MNTDTSTAVRTETLVEAPIERAFKVFTEEMETWWDADHHLGDTPLAEMVVERHVGGRIFDRHTDGSECQWSRVLAYEPPTLFVFSWDINTRWELETDPDKTSEVAGAIGPLMPAVPLTGATLPREVRSGSPAILGSCSSGCAAI